MHLLGSPHSITAHLGVTQDFPRMLCVLLWGGRLIVDWFAVVVSFPLEGRWSGQFIAQPGFLARHFRPGLSSTAARGSSTALIKALSISNYPIASTSPHTLGFAFLSFTITSYLALTSCFACWLSFATAWANSTAAGSIVEGLWIAASLRRITAAAAPATLTINQASFQALQPCSYLLNHFALISVATTGCWWSFAAAPSRLLIDRTLVSTAHRRRLDLYSSTARP